MAGAFLQYVKIFSCSDENQLKSQFYSLYLLNSGHSKDIPIQMNLSLNSIS